LFFNDEGDERAGLVPETTSYVADVRDLSNPFLVRAIRHFGGCWIDHDEMVRGDRVYQAQYTAGVRVIDVSDPLTPTEVAYFDTHPENNAQSFDGVWGVYAGFPRRVVIASDIERGLFVLCDEPDRPIAGFTVDPNPGRCGTSIHLDASSSAPCDPTHPITTYEWDFDYDGSFLADKTGIKVTREYVTSGDRAVALRVTNDIGAQDVSVFAISVECSTPIPTVSEWGLMATALLLVTAGSLVIVRRRPSSAYPTYGHPVGPE
jgi:hypothetical protein